MMSDIILAAVAAAIGVYTIITRIEIVPLGRSGGIGYKRKPRSFRPNYFLLCVVPGLIALLFAATFAYLLIANNQTPNYTVPKELDSAIKVIIGYLFGVGASSKANEG